jgi:hypothetical protein
MKLQMPPAIDAAGAASETAQQRYRRAVAASLVLLIVASIGGLSEEPIGGWISAAAFVLALALTVRGPTTNWQRDWHEGRFVRERGKSLTWKYAVGGAPFGLATEDAKDAYDHEIEEATKHLPGHHDAPQAPADATGPAQVRGRELEQRRAAYRAGRLQNQIDYYTRKAEKLRSSARFWRCAAILFQLLGIAGAVWKGLEHTERDWLALFATIAAAVVAWREVDDDQFMADTCRNAQRALEQLARREPSGDAEAEWASYVAEVESTLTREHNLWIARRA